MSELLRNLSLQEEVYTTPSESLWKGQWNRGGERSQVSVLCLRKDNPAILASLQLYRFISNNPKISNYIVPLLANDSKALVFSPCICTLETYIEKNQSSLRNGIWFQKKGFNVIYILLRSLRLLHKQGIVHGNVSLRTIFMTEDRMMKLGDFRSARDTTDEEDMKRDVAALAEVAAYFYGNCTYNVGNPPGHRFTTLQYEELHKDLARTIQEISQMTASEAIKRFERLREPVPAIVSIPSVSSVSPNSPRSAIAQLSPIDISYQHPDASVLLQKIKDAINTDTVNEAQLGEYIRRFQQLVPQLRGFALQLVTN